VSVKPATTAVGADDGTDGDTRFAMLATVFGGDATTLDNGAGDAIEVIFVSTGAPGSVYPRLHLRVDGSRPLRLVERHLGGSAPDALVCTQIRVELLAGATLDHYRLQDCATQALWFDTVTASVGANANYRLRQLMAGAATARSTASVMLAGSAASFDWHGVAAIHQRQTADLLVRVVHQAAATRTAQLFRGIAADQAHIGFDADIQVHSAAAGSRVRQSLRGLIDGKGAAVNLRPRLTIHTDDIQASHGATSGQLDEHLLFYLLSRGLEPETARALLKWAFLGDALAAIDIVPLRREAERAAAGHLAGQMADGVVAGLLA
jgi:Fe-S cluster assembly protein SufD